jgi:hypothetical protein
LSLFTCLSIYISSFLSYSLSLVYIIFSCFSLLDVFLSLTLAPYVFSLPLYSFCFSPLSMLYYSYRAFFLALSLSLLLPCSLPCSISILSLFMHVSMAYQFYYRIYVCLGSISLFFSISSSSLSLIIPLLFSIPVISRFIYIILLMSLYLSLRKHILNITYKNYSTDMT